MKINQLILIILLLQLYSSSYGQSDDIEMKRHLGSKKLISKLYDDCCLRKGNKSIYKFDQNGCVIKYSFYRSIKLVSTIIYHYNDHGLLIEKIMTYNRNHKRREDTTSFDYKFDSSNRMIKRTTKYKWHVATEEFSDFDSLNNPQSTLFTSNSWTYVLKRKFDSAGRVIWSQKVSDNIVRRTEESRFNAYGDEVYSYVPTLLDESTGKMKSLIGGNRHAIIEFYEYTYDKSNRWTRKFLLLDNRKVLLEERTYR